MTTGIEVALTGRLGRPPEPRTTRAGNPMLILNLAVDEGDDADACCDLEPGARVYFEGRLKAEAYLPRDGGEPRVSLTVLCRLAQPLGRIGRRRPRRPTGAPQARDQPPAASYHRPEPERAPAGGKPAPADLAAEDPPFDDIEALEEIGR